MSEEKPQGCYTPRTILVTGAAGFIASHVTNRLVRHHPHYRVVALDKLDYCSTIRNLSPSTLSSPNFMFVRGDVASSDLLLHLLLSEAVDTVMHFAAHTHVDTSFGNSVHYTTNNVYGTHVLLEACRLAGAGTIRRFIHVSTDEVYGETGADANGPEESQQLLPSNPYSATKAAAEMLVLAYRRSYGLPAITTRGSNVYGPNQFPEKLIPKFMLLAMRGESLPIHGDGSNLRSFLYCDDAAEAFDVILHHGQIGQVYNVGTDKERRVIDVAEDICQLLNMDPTKSISFVSNRPFNDQRYIFHDQNLQSLGWFPRTEWHEGLSKTKHWYMHHPQWWDGDLSAALLPHPPHSDEGPSRPLRFLIYGRDGWIGGMLGRVCTQMGVDYEYGTGRVAEREEVVRDVRRTKPSHVLYAVDWCREAVSAHVVGTLTVADVCTVEGVGMVHYRTRCEEEDDELESTPLSYAKINAMVEDLLKEYDNACILRLQMPVSSDLSNPRNLIGKIIQNEKLLKNMTVLDELLPLSIEMAKRGCRGVWDFANPGIVSHAEMVEMYQKCMDPGLTFVKSKPGNQAKTATSARGDDEASVCKLKREFPQLLDIKDSLLKHVFSPSKKA